MAFMKKHQDNAPSNQDVKSNLSWSRKLEGALDNLAVWDLYIDVADQKEASNSVAAKKADNQAKAEALQNASLGMLPPTGW